jgi:hypothetical protein
MNSRQKNSQKVLPIKFVDASGRSLKKLPGLLSAKENLQSPNRSGVRENEYQFEKLEDVVKNANLVLFQARTIFPFELFPSEIVIDPVKLTVISRDFFVSGQTQSVYIKDIMDVIIETGPFFSSLRIVDIGYAQNKLSIKYLLRKDASCARQILEGLLAGTKAGVDFSCLKKGEILRVINSLKGSYSSH